MSLTNKKVEAYDMVGQHPVNTRYSKKGQLYLIKDVEKALRKHESKMAIKEVIKNGWINWIQNWNL